MLFAIGAAIALGTTVGLAALDVTSASGERRSHHASHCAGIENLTVDGAEHQDEYCLDDLTTEGTEPAGRTNRAEWSGVASGTRNPDEPVPGIQIDGYFPDTSTTNRNNGYDHDSQFVIRLPDEWNGKLVITGAPGLSGQYANDLTISDWVLARGYAFASTDKGNRGPTFYTDGQQPGDAAAEWHFRVSQLTRATKGVVAQRYGSEAERTYITGISNGGYLTRYALENSPGLYDGGVDWEGALFRDPGPNLLTYLPAALRHYPRYAATGDEAAHEAMIDAGFAPGSEFLWPHQYVNAWDSIQRVVREEFDPGYDGDLQAGIPFCQSGTPNCDADYDYASRPAAVHDAIRRVSLDGGIGKPMITLHGTLDALLPIGPHSDVYENVVGKAGAGSLHRYYRIEDGAHGDPLYDVYPDRLRPLLPCHREAFRILEDWVEKGKEPPQDATVPRPEGGDLVNRCDLGRESTDGGNRNGNHPKRRERALHRP